MDIKINTEFEKLIPPLSNNERTLLEASILAEGCRDALITWNGWIVDGHNRYAICQEHDIDFDMVEKDFEDENEAKLWMLDNQAGRRNLTDGWLWQLVQTKREILLKMGGEKRERKPDEFVLSKLDKTKEPHNTRKAIANDLGWSTGKAARAQYVWDHAEPEVIEDVKSGEVSIHRAYSKAKKENSKEKAIESRKIPPPDGKYNIIYADPPWKYTSGDQHAKEEQDTVLGTHYPSMSITELCELPIKHMATDNAVLFLWVTSPLLAECFDIISAWGFKYKASIVWNKDAHNVGHYVSVRHEFLLICTRGSFLPDSGKLLPSVVTEKRTDHSVKPETFRSMIDQMYTEGRRIELFARKRVENWDAWGNEC